MNTKEQFFDTLWSRMTKMGDFPTLQFTVDNMVKTLDSDLSTGDLATAVLADFSLAQKVIRLANSPMYSSFGGEVTTVSRAIMVLGVDAVVHLALGLQLLDTFAGSAAKHPQANEELRRAMLAGEIARTLSASQGISQGEEAVVCALMHHLSRLLLVFYFPEEWSRIQLCCDNRQSDESAACVEILGVSLEEIAHAAAIKWRLPAKLARTLAHASLAPEDVAESHDAWLGAMAKVSTKAAAMAASGGNPAVIHAHLMRHAEALGLQKAAVDAATKHVQELNAAILSSEKASPAKEKRQEVGKPLNANLALRQALTEVKGVADDLTVSELIPLVLESTMQALNLTNCFIMLLNPSVKSFVAKIGFGPNIRQKLPHLSFEEGFVPDIFHFAVTSGKPVVLENTLSPEISHRVPRWYREQYPDSKTVILAPISIKNRCVAVVCGDWGVTQESNVSPSELTSVDRLVNEIGAGLQRNLVRR